MTKDDLTEAFDWVQSLERKYPSDQYISQEAHSILMVCYVIFTRLEKLTHSLNDNLAMIVESIDCASAGAITPVFWMHSDLAAIDKAKELGIDILPEYSIADLRYKIDCALREVL